MLFSLANNTPTMKLKTIVALLLSAGLSQAALYTVTTGTAATSNGIGNSAGIAFQNSANASFAGPGVTQFGIFSTDSLSNLTAPQLIAAFTAWGGTNTFAAPGPAGTRGAFTNAAGARTVAGSEFAGDQMYVFVGNATTFAASTEFLVLRTNFTFNASDDSNPNPIVNTINFANSTVLFGGTVTDLRTTTADASVTPGWITAAPVPEPSVALLGALGLFGLVRRRR